ncbi:hypothetical protein ABEB36_013945 [Hypothenemus hampei]|uniref:Tyr recombinase domain-containing protein n=1 Tax=Hypothenemus hampei TaxID=57062 RepID=A0ABD1E602_HYPHA
MFNRKRIGDVQYLQLEAYTKSNSNFENPEEFHSNLTSVEKILSKKFKRVVTDGKHSKPVPILFPRKVHKFISILIEVRQTFNIVPSSNPYLFANPNSTNSWMSGVHVLQRLAKASQAQKPHLLTSTKFRKHIATTLQLMDMQSDEMEQVATFMGHTKKTHEDFYRLPQDIYQTVKVAKVLLLLEKGRGREFKGKSLNDIQLQREVYYSSEDEDAMQDEHDFSSIEGNNADNIQENSLKRISDSVLISNEESNNLNKKKRISTFHTENIQNKSTSVFEIEKSSIENNITGKENDPEECNNEMSELSSLKVYKKKNKKSSETNQNASSTVIPKISFRSKWSREEQNIVKRYFRENIKNKITPRKTECEDFLKQYGNQFLNKDWVRIKTFVYNQFRNN